MARPAPLEQRLDQNAHQPVEDLSNKLAEFLRAEGVRSGMINLGGNILLLGGKPDGSPWKVGLQRPREDSCEWAATVEAEDVSVVTSGIYERGYDKHGARLHHVLNIKTGRPVESDLAAVSVICESSTDADAYSTAFLCMGSERTKKLLKQRPSFKVFLQKIFQSVHIGFSFCSKVFYINREDWPDWPSSH